MKEKTRIRINKKFSVERSDPSNFKVVHHTSYINKKGKKKDTESYSYFSKLEIALNFILTHSSLDEASSLQEVLQNIQETKNQILRAVYSLDKST